MALGGGTFVTQNKVLPGAYINFVAAAKSTAALSERGTAAMAFTLDWGIDGEIFEVSAEAFQKDSLKLFGYDYAHEKMKGLRDLFRNIKKLYAYKLNSEGAKASNDYAEARYTGVRGNDLKIVIQKNVDDDTKFDVKTMLDSATIDRQTAASASELADNDFVIWKKSAALAVTASEPLAGGTNGTAPAAAQHQAFLDKAEAYAFNALGVVEDSAQINQLYAAFCKRLRDEMGMKFQTVVHNSAADYEGVVNAANDTEDAGWPKASLVYWVTGLIAGCEINKSNLNRPYDGEFSVHADFTQSQLEQAVRQGQFMLHRVGSELRVLEDINSLVTVGSTKGEPFKDNQTIRILDQIGNDIATIFGSKYLGTVQNNESGRISLWNDIVTYHKELVRLGAVEEMDSKEITVEPGEAKKAVAVNYPVTPINCMSQLYMTVLVQ